MSDTDPVALAEALLADEVGRTNPVQLRAALELLVQFCSPAVFVHADPLHAPAKLKHGQLYVECTCADCGQRTPVPLGAEAWCRHCVVGR